MAKTQAQAQSNQPLTLTPKQCEMMTRLLNQAKQQAAKTLEPDSDLKERVEAEIVPKLAKEHGIAPLAEKIRKLRKDLHDAERQLCDRGFSCDDKSISLSLCGIPDILSRAMDNAVREARQERDAQLKKYDLAILGVSVAKTPDEAKKIVEATI